MRTIVFGAGGVGGVIAGYLARGGRNVVVVDPWFHHVEAIRADGLRVQAIEEEFVAEVPVIHVDELDRLGEADLAVVAMKSYDTEWASLVLREHLRPDGIAISAQNGMNEPKLQSVFGAERTVGCVVAMAVELVETGCVKRTSGEEWGTVVVGELGGGVGDRVEALVEHLAPMGGVSASPDIEQELWGKLTLNVMSNALGGITGFTTTKLWTDDDVVDVIVGLGHETARLAEACGVRLAPVLKSIEHDLLVAAENRSAPAWRTVHALMNHAGASRVGARENTPSLLQDVRKGRRTEIDHLNGWIAAESQARGLCAPLNEAIVGVVREVELGRQPCSKDNLAPLLELLAVNDDGGDS